MSTNDALLIERWRTTRDPEAFRELVDRYSGMVYATCRRVLRNSEDAKDAAQECFVELMRASVVPSPTLGPWLYTVAVRRSLDFAKSAGRRRRREHDYQEGPTAVQAPPEGPELLAYIDEAIAALPDPLRVVVVGCFLESRSHESLAKEQGVSESTVRYRLDKAIEQVRQSLQRRGISVTAVALAAVLGSKLVEAAPASLTASLAKFAIGGVGPRIRGVAVTAPKASILGGLTAGKLIAAATAVLLLGTSLIYILQGGEKRQAVAQIPPEARLDSTKREEARPPLPEPGEHSSPLSTAGILSALLVPNHSAPAEELPALDEEHPRTVFGTVTDAATGDAVPGARVSVVTWNSFTDSSIKVWYGETDTAGQYVVPGVFLRENYNFFDACVTAPGFQYEGRRVEIKKGEERTEVNFQVSAGVSLIARVVDSSGKPIDKATVCSKSAYTGTAGSTNYCLASTDGSGLFTMGFRDAGIASLLVIAPDAGQSFFPDVPIGKNRTIELKMTPPAQMSGKVTYADGTPAAEVTVSLDARYAPDGGHPRYAASIGSWD